MAGELGRHLSRFLNRSAGQRQTPLASPDPAAVDPVYPRVMVISYDPIVPGQSGRRLSRYFGWNQFDELVQQAISDLSQVSHGYCNFQVVEQKTVDTLPIKIDGFRYQIDDYIAAWRSDRGFHQPDWADYHRILADHQVAERVEAGQIDELWLFAFPYGGFYESRMAGPGAFWCNSPPLNGYEHLPRRFVMMGFNYERGVGEMLESLGHRAESIMAQVYRQTTGEKNLWSLFTRYDLAFPGRAEVGTVHFAPNSQRDYDWGNRRLVPSRCDNWLSFPDIEGQPRLVNCRDWGNGDTRLHHLWWFKHFPHGTGRTNGISNNWWEYVIEPDRVV